MPGALTWDPTPPGGGQSTARGDTNPAMGVPTLSASDITKVKALVDGDGSSALIKASNRLGVTLNSAPAASRGILARLRSDIIGASTTVDERDLQAIAPHLERLLRTGVYNKLLELWLPVGNSIAAAMFKLKGVATRQMTANSLLDADFTRWAGVTGNGSTKDISTGFSASAYASGSWGCAVYPTNNASVPGGQTLLGDGSQTYLGFGNGDCKISGSPTMPLSPTSRLLWIQKSPSGSACGYGGTTNNTATAGSSAGGTIRLLSYGGSLYSANSVGGFAAWSGTLTTIELQVLQQFFDHASEALGRHARPAVLVAAGDSNTFGAGLGTPTTQRWSALLAADLGLTEQNQGLSGSSMVTATANGGSSGVWETTYPVSRTAWGGVLLTAMFGTNDDRYGASLADFARGYEVWLNRQFEIGWLPANIMLMSPGPATDALSSRSRQMALRDSVAALADKYGTEYTDVFAALDGQSGMFQGDALHYSVAGHVAINAAVKAAYSA